MAGHGNGLIPVVLQGQLILPVLKDVRYGRIIIQSAVGSPPASVYKSFAAHSCGKVQYPPARLVGLFRVLLLIHDTAYVCFHIGMYGGGFGKELVRIPVRHEAVSGSQVLFTGGIAVRSETAGMGGYLLVTEEDLYLPGVIKDVDFLAYVFAGNAVVMVLNPYVPVLHGSGGVTLFEFKTDRVKRAYAVTLDFLILFTAAVSASGEGGRCYAVPKPP